MVRLTLFQNPLAPLSHDLGDVLTNTLSNSQARAAHGSWHNYGLHMAHDIT